MGVGGGGEGGLNLVAQVRQMQGRVARAWRQIWKSQILHVWRHRGEDQRRVASVSLQGARHAGVEEVCRALAAGFLGSESDGLPLQALARLGEQGVS